jgi:hypothetical protein
MNYTNITRLARSLRSDHKTKDMQDWVKGLDATFFNKGIHKLVMSV